MSAKHAFNSRLNEAISNFKINMAHKLEDGFLGNQFLYEINMMSVIISVQSPSVPGKVLGREFIIIIPTSLLSV